MMSPIRYIENGTNSSMSSHGFANYTAQHIANRLNEYQGANICICGYTPTADGKLEGPLDYVELAFIKMNMKEIRIGIEFGETPTGEVPFNRGFDHSEWIKNNCDPTKSTISALSFDEAWRVICQIALHMNAESISIAYGSHQAIPSLFVASQD